MQVPVTYAQTYYRQECRTETVPVTRMVPELVNETRTVTCYIPQQRVVNKPVTRYVCEPTTVVQKCYRPIPVTRTVERTIYQTYCTTEMVNKVITRMVPECVNETVPVTKMRKVIEPQLCTVTQRIPATSYVPVVTCRHSCGHRCGGGGCGQCGGATVCVSLPAGADLHLPASAGHEADARDTCLKPAMSSGCERNSTPCKCRFASR